MFFFMMFMLISITIKNWGNLYGMGMVFHRLIVITSIIGIILSFFNHRTWCNFCPMGALSSLIAKVIGRKTNMNVGNSCVSCNLCTHLCFLKSNFLVPLQSYAKLLLLNYQSPSIHSPGIF